MLRAVALWGLLLLSLPRVVHAQTPPAAPASEPSDVAPMFSVGSTEVMITAGPAFGEEIFHSSSGYRYVLSSFSWGLILTGPVGPGVLRGRFEWAVEAVPVLAQYAPYDTYGAGVSPLTWRWNFDPHGKLAPYVELAGGLLWTRNPLPEQTTTANFTAHASYGVRYFFQDRTAFVASYTFHHVSNGNRLDRNPGINAHMALVGFSFFRPR
jgi:hypothetical protein